jgi:Recombinase/Recombinase zinc beta ribbon domain
VRLIFEMCATGHGLNAITRTLEERGVPTKTGKTLWHRNYIKALLKNTLYAGTKYFNKYTKMTIQGTGTKSYRANAYRDRSEWIGIPVPAIVTQELFDSVQAMLKRGEERYRQPPVHHLLRGLITCGECGARFSSYRRYAKRSLTSGAQRITHKAAYVCNWGKGGHAHDPNHIKRCYNCEVATHVLEDAVFKMLRDVLLDPKKLRECVTVAAPSESGDHRGIARRLAGIVARIGHIGDERRRVTDLYASDKMQQDAYINTNIALDTELNDLKRRKAEITAALPADFDGARDVRLRQLGERAKARLDRCTDFDAKRQFLLDHVTSIIYRPDKVTLLGSLPADHLPLQDARSAAIPFRMEGEIDRAKLRSAARKSLPGDARFKQWRRAPELNTANVTQQETAI